MKTSKVILALTALVLAAAMLLSACGVKDDSKTTAAGTSSAGEPAMTEEPATEEPTTAKPKYSPSDKLIALTFDDGPAKNTTADLLDILKQYDVKATFFVQGVNVDGYNIPDNAEVIKRAAAMGCSIGNHTKDHKILTKCNADTVKAQVNGVNSLLRDMGIEPTLFRAPGGAFKGVKDQIGMPLIQWSIDTEDWKFKDASHKGRSAEERAADLNRIADMVFSQAKGGSIVLMHDIYDFTADLCEIVIPGLVERGFKLVTVDQLFEAYGEKLENGVVYYSAKLPEPSARPASAEPIAAGKYTVSTSGSVLNMRVSPDADSQVLEKIPNGTIVEVTKSVLGWAYVTYNSAQGWVSSAYLV